MHVIWKEDERRNFTFEHAWLDQLKENSSKRTKIYVNGYYLLSPNPETLIEVSESDTPSRIPCPMGQKAAKWKIKGKGGATSTPIVDLSGIEVVFREKNISHQKVSKGKVVGECSSVV